MPDTTAAQPDAFGRLAPFIQEFIWRNQWTELRGIQVRATAAAFDTQNHLLLAAGTASGKTEAAFLPILTQLAHDRPAGIGALYIGPLKALINDQFMRLNDLCAEAEIPVTAWHGDVAVSRKRSLLRAPSGILQITPESLEGMLLNRSTELQHLFGDLRWVVIDEIHAFMASDRGGQVIALLDRLARYARDRQRLPRRMGLSATLGDYRLAAAWLAGGDPTRVTVIDESASRQVFLCVDEFAAGQRQSDDAPGPDASTQSDAKASRAGADDDAGMPPELVDAAYAATAGRKTLIFANTRADTEEIVTALRRQAERRTEPDIFYVHHGSIAAPLREAAETAMRDGDGPACTAATITLELGIDLGHLDRVLQLGPTATVASFLQRLGRAGRRGQRPEMFFLLSEERPGTQDDVLERLPWELLQTIAVIQLYAEEHWIEPISPPVLPTSLLYQQIMSVAAAAGELSPAQLAERVLTLAPFNKVTQDDFRELLRHLLSIDHLERTPEGGLILGLAGEKVVRNYRFLATFADSTEWAVKDGSNNIGSIGSPVPVGERFALAGRTWVVQEVLEDQRTLIVKRIRGAVRTAFIGGSGADVHDRVVDRMRRALAEDADYSYLTDRAALRLHGARALARTAGLLNPVLLPLGGDRVGLLPWCGTRALRTIQLRVAGHELAKQLSQQQYYLEITAPSGRAEEVPAALRGVASEPWDASAMTAGLPRHVYERGKYDGFVPDGLLQNAFRTDVLDVDGARRHLGCATHEIPSGRP